VLCFKRYLYVSMKTCAGNYEFLFSLSGCHICNYELLMCVGSGFPGYFISVVRCKERSGSNTRVYPKVSGLAAWSENCK